MRTIYKYEVPLEGAVHMVPKGAILQHVACQYRTDTVSFWAGVSAEHELEERRFIIRGTGMTVPDNADFVGTAIVDGGDLVWHLYEVPV